MPVQITPPAPPAVPALFDSPHSGTVYPEDFRPVLDMAILRRSEDTFVEELFDAAPACGAPLIAASFPRSYIDPNRNELDIEAAMLETQWPGPLAPTIKTTIRSAGLIFGRIADTYEIYDRKLTVAEVQARIDNYWRPYHDAVANGIESLHATFGRVYHVDCHSMPARGDATSDDGPVERADFVLGDRDGTTCDGAFTDAVRAELEAMGYWVKINDPMKGVELVRRYSDPSAGRHSLQIEVNRRLYMDEITIERNNLFAKTKADLDRLVETICAYAANAG